MNNILVIATYDSFLRTGLSVAENIENAIIDIAIRTTASNQLSENQLKYILKNKKYNLFYFFMNDYKKIDYNSYDIIILSAGNEFIKSFFNFYLFNSLINKKRIITISLFPGVIFGDIDSIASRMNADILLCNNKIDYDIACKIKKVYKTKTNIMLYGFPILKKLNLTNAPKNSIYFFEQVKIPETYTDRYYLITKLVEYASRNPDRMVYIKPRVAPNEKTVHINHYPMEKLLKDYESKNKIPTNLLITYKSIEECFYNMKLGITLSSTVAIEAIYNKIPMAIISDFGLRKDFANSEFLESGCLVSFDDLEKKELIVSSYWYDRMIYFPENRVKLFNELLVEANDKKSYAVSHIGLESIEYIRYKESQYISKNKKRFLKAVKNPRYTLSVLWNFIKR